MKLTDKEFCKMYTAFYGEEIDKAGQLVSAKFTGEELKEFIDHCIKLSNNGVLGDVNCFSDDKVEEAYEDGHYDGTIQRSKIFDIKIYR